MLWMSKAVQRIHFWHARIKDSTLHDTFIEVIPLVSDECFNHCLASFSLASHFPLGMA